MRLQRSGGQRTRRAAAEHLVGACPPDDLAVIKLDQPPASLVPANFGNSAQLRVSAIVVALPAADGLVPLEAMLPTGR